MMGKKCTVHAHRTLHVVCHSPQSHTSTMAAAVNPNSDPFRGGSFTPGANPLAVGGSIAPASTGGSLIGSVAGATPMLARNDRGSNITIPYARVCFHPAGRTALGPIEGDATKTADHLNATLGKPNGNLIVETELLYSGRIAFILGRRGKDYDAGVASTVGFDAMNTFGATPGNLVHSRQAGFLAQFAVGGSDMNTAQRLCSFEYLQRYFHHVLRTKVVEIGDRKIFADKGALVAKGHRSFQLLANATLDATKLTSVKTATLLDDVKAKYKGTEDATLKGAAPDSGLFLYDNGPFLRGKCLDHRLYKLREGSSNKKTSLALGDNFAFEELQRLIAATGACDWTPDGVVLSKLSQGDKLLDDELDSRDGQLYNVTVSGPAVSSSWTGDYHREVMPLDKVFVVIVADVWHGVNNTGTGSAKEYKDKRGFDIQGTDYAAYKNAKAAAAAANNLSGGRDAGKIGPLVTADDKTAAITNMRVRLVTSSEMVNCSAMKPGKDNTTTVDPTSRMGLMISGNDLGNDGVSEYIIGGWCIGTVIDSAASRAVPDSMSMFGGVKRAKSSMSCNVSVNVKWWSADKMYRAYMNRDGKNRARYDGPKGLPDKTSRKAGQRG